jgi:hypothetical protein
MKKKEEKCWEKKKNTEESKEGIPGHSCMEKQPKKKCDALV